MTTLAELGAISKAAKYKKPDSDEYRRSRLAGLNPRSDTYVRRGARSMARRVGAPVLGGALGGAAGEAAGRAAFSMLPKKYRASSKMGRFLQARRWNRKPAGIGGIVGTSAGLTRNIRTGDTKSYNYATGKKARGKVKTGVVPGYLNVY